MSVGSADGMIVGCDDGTQVDEHILLTCQRHLTCGALAVLCGDLHVREYSLACQQLLTYLTVLITAGGIELHLYRLPDIRRKAARTTRRLY